MNLLLLAPLLVSTTPLADGGEGDWPAWRGPARDGISRETGWTPAGAEKDVWRAEVGLGYSSVVLANGRLYTLGFDTDTEMDVVRCLDAATGKELWAHAYEAAIWAKYHAGGTLTTPTIDGDAVYTVNREGEAFRLDAKTGEVDWNRNDVKELGLELPTWGFSASPFVREKEVILNLGRVLALDKKTGKILWKSEDLGHAYSTPTEFVFGGKPVLAVFNGKGLAVLDLADGKRLALHPWTTQYDVNAATPIVIGDDTIFISSGYNHGAALLKLTAEGFETLWETKEMKNKMSGCVLVDGHLYGFDEAVLTCLGLDGKVKWAERGIGNGALMASDGKLIVIGGKGQLLIVAADPAGYRELSREQVLPEGGVFWSMPVLAGSLIYCRSNSGELVCRDHRGTQ